MSNMRALALGREGSRVALPWVVWGGASVAVTVVLAVQPWLAAGITVGIAILALTFTRPLWVIGLMLALGPLDLSFVTGGFKELFPNLGGLDMNGIRLIGISGGLLLVIAADVEILGT